ncbi:hypothetical protein [Montanilutibacter psychrotolerans]|uniref:hypothetical protein n=1 Tax=Montanilutibacter psychrotolerans TaxID=1327343 RepID=UPI0011CE34BF|nr:hypothetical protein [Lysobacter psychrotolerans]
MRNPFASLLKASPRNPTSPLKMAFQRSREQRNIDLVWAVLRETKLFVVVAADPSTTDQKECYFLTKSPNPDRWCVTVSERHDALDKVPWPKKEISGQELMRDIEPAIEIVVVYPDGGDYITREQLEWYRQLG